MLIAKTHYQDTAARDIMVTALSDSFDKLEADPIFICIGSEHHLLDCLGPLTGTMLRDKAKDITAFGTLDHPLHAQNLVKELREIKRMHPGKIEIVIDASVGEEEEIGLIQFRQGSLLPGRAYAKNLPAIGHFSITGVVEVRLRDQQAKINKRPGLLPVYRLAQLLSESIIQWHNEKNRGKGLVTKYW